MITFPSGLDAAECASRLRSAKRRPYAKQWPYARHAIRLIDGHCRHVVLLIGERIATRQDIDPAQAVNAAAPMRP